MLFLLLQVITILPPVITEQINTESVLRSAEERKKLPSIQFCASFTCNHSRSNSRVCTVYRCRIQASLRNEPIAPHVRDVLNNKIGKWVKHENNGAIARTVYVSGYRNAGWFHALDGLRPFWYLNRIQRVFFFSPNTTAALRAVNEQCRNRTHRKINNPRRDRC